MNDLFANSTAVILFFLYAAALLFIFIYSLVQLDLVKIYLKAGKSKPWIDKPDRLVSRQRCPIVTVQLPIYNEIYVIERLINAVANIDYPSNKLEIQIIDDSDDETGKLIQTRVKELQDRGFMIAHIRRNSRDGFKAGALSYGLSLAKGEFIAIFDADFLPPPDFLSKTIPYFADKEIGLVQTKWEHINERYSLLTRMQAFALDAHFSIEQVGRNAGGHFINFNGTAGIWRKTCILDAGNWQSDTLTEDLDLSYRAQMKGWKFLYLEHIGSPAELPVTMNAVKNQQFRWTKGALECLIKNLPSVLASNRVSLSTKIHATFHLMNSAVFFCILLAALLSIPLLFIKSTSPGFADAFLYASASPSSLFLLGYFYYVAAKQKPGITLLSFLPKFFLFLSVFMGLSLNNSIALFEGCIRKKSPFNRTPKLNIVSKKDSWQGKKYFISGINMLTVFEGLLFLYCIAGIFFDIYFRNYGLLLFHVMLVLGFGYVFGYSIVHSRVRRCHA